MASHNRGSFRCFSSSRSTSGSDCVEVAYLDGGMVGVRDSKTQPAQRSSSPPPSGTPSPQTSRTASSPGPSTRQPKPPHPSRVVNWSLGTAPTTTISLPSTNSRERNLPLLEWSPVDARSRLTNCGNPLPPIT
ncbi:DUF397 domain-containing protein [Nocardia sp. CA-135398]|uniref:DUF397 domain-containing protein n=1 Tax=Nocardia sp. CA-135398 TaxID=3239977 RepID=UPI003D978969